MKTILFLIILINLGCARGYTAYTVSDSNVQMEIGYYESAPGILTDVKVARLKVLRPDGKVNGRLIFVREEEFMPFSDTHILSIREIDHYYDPERQKEFCYQIGEFKGHEYWHFVYREPIGSYHYLGKYSTNGIRLDAIKENEKFIKENLVNEKKTEPDHKGENGAKSNF